MQVVRGAPSPAAPAGVEIGFGDAGAQQVRWCAARLSARSALLRRVETVSFAEPGRPAVMVVRGGSDRQFAVGLFQSVGGEPDRIAFAVDGVGSARQGSADVAAQPDGRRGRCGQP